MATTAPTVSPPATGASATTPSALPETAASARLTSLPFTGADLQPFVYLGTMFVVLGIVLIAMSGGQWSWSDTWVSMGMGVWAVVAVVAEAVLWPGERHLQTVVAGWSGGTPDEDPGRTGQEAAACLRTGLVGLGLGVAMVAVAVLMVAKP